MNATDAGQAPEDTGCQPHDHVSPDTSSSAWTDVFTDSLQIWRVPVILAGSLGGACRHTTATCAAVLPERRDYPLPSVLPATARVIASPGLSRLALQVIQGGGVAFHDRGPDAVGYPLPGCCSFAVGLLCGGSRVG